MNPPRRPVPPAAGQGAQGNPPRARSKSQPQVGEQPKWQALSSTPATPAGEIGALSPFAADATPIKRSPAPAGLRFDEVLKRVAQRRTSLPDHASAGPKDRAAPKPPEVDVSVAEEAPTAAAVPASAPVDAPAAAEGVPAATQGAPHEDDTLSSFEEAPDAGGASAVGGDASGASLPAPRPAWEVPSSPILCKTELVAMLAEALQVAHTPPARHRARPRPVTARAAPGGQGRAVAVVGALARLQRLARQVRAGAARPFPRPCRHRCRRPACPCPPAADAPTARA